MAPTQRATKPKRPASRPNSPLRPPRPDSRRSLHKAVKEKAARPDSPAEIASATADLPTEKLQKVLARAGLGSRRSMETLIEQGRVEVNGVTAGLGLRVSTQDRITVDRRPVRLHAVADAPRVLLYHKPQGEIVTAHDPEGRPTVFDRLPRLEAGKWVAVGRLDFNTSGLLLLTDSGDLANRLMHPRAQLEREYAVRVKGQLTAEQERQLMRGVVLEDGPARFDSIRFKGGEGANRWYEVTLREGRNREVRRMFEALGLGVSRLIRIRFGPVKLPPRLGVGRWLELDAAAIRALGG